MSLTTHWDWVHEFAKEFGEDISETALELNIPFSEAVALYSFVLQLSTADLEEDHRQERRKYDL